MSALRILAEEQDLERRIEPSGAWRVRYFSSIDSTMHAARAMVSELSSAQAALAIADRQLAGRGRQGRAWSEAQSGFYGTFAFRVAQRDNLPSFSLVTGLVIAEYLRENGVAVQLKWPNDILSLKRKKCAGILLEFFEQQGQGYLLIGIGINIVGAPASEAHAVALDQIGAGELSSKQIALGLAPKLLAAFNQFSREGFAAFCPRWLEYSIPVGEQIRAHHGSSIVRGTFAGVSSSGELLLEIEGVIQSLSSAELLLNISEG